MNEFAAALRFHQSNAIGISHGTHAGQPDPSTRNMWTIAMGMMAMPMAAGALLVSA
ncbi:hypothetical protein [Streptomyces yangpuensis]|uniref:hypothetical protein n=1 Tax=Streptomyces yangpuensis TaxID=1648182 RepID=UPI0036647B4A